MSIAKGLKTFLESKIFYLFCGAVFLFSCGYISGSLVTAVKCELKISENVAKSEKEYAAALEKKNETQANISNAFTKSQSDLVSSLEATTAYYDSLISVDLRLPTEWVQSDDATDSKDGDLSDNTRTSHPVQRASCKCTCDNGAKLQRLYKQQLTVAKDCDITTGYYNSLLKLYESVRHAQN